jgi:hypothetical protein
LFLKYDPSTATIHPSLLGKEAGTVSVSMLKMHRPNPMPRLFVMNAARIYRRGCRVAR